MIRKERANRAPETICISSGKGGVGKTSFAVNVAASLARKKRTVLLIDGDLGLANVDVMLGLNVRHTSRETIEKDRDPAGLLVRIMPGFEVLPASSGVPELANLSPEEQRCLTNALEKIIHRFDFVLVDTAAGLGASVLWFNAWAEKNFVVLSPDPASLTDAYALIKVLASRYDKKNFHLLINNVQSQKEGKEIFRNMSMALGKFLGITPDSLGAIPRDSTVVRAVRMQKPFLLAAPDARASAAVERIADTMISG